MGKNKIGEALLKINSGQPGSPIGPEQPKRIPTMNEYWTYSNSDKYKPGSDVYEPINEDMRSALLPKMMKNINWNDMDYRLGQILNQPVELDPNNNNAPKDPNWYKKGQVATMDGVGKMLDLLEKNGATPASALTIAREYMRTPGMRKMVFGDNPAITSDQSLRHWLIAPGIDATNPKTDIQNQPITGTKLEQFADRIADLYGNLYKKRAGDFNINPQTQMSTQQAAPVQGGMQGLQQGLTEKLQQSNPKLRVTKTP
jgi:hypothetical protein